MAPVLAGCIRVENRLAASVMKTLGIFDSCADDDFSDHAANLWRDFAGRIFSEPAGAARQSV